MPTTRKLAILVFEEIGRFKNLTAATVLHDGSF
jgi:hypothetical protein